MKNKLHEVIHESKTEIIKEYYIDIPKYKDRIFGRISKTTYSSGHVQFVGDFSHYYLTGKGASEYFRECDDNIIVADFEYADTLVTMYLEDFTIDFGKPKKNKFFLGISK